jgi:hypothetical protein
LHLASTFLSADLVPAAAAALAGLAIGFVAGRFAPRRAAGFRPFRARRSAEGPAGDFVEIYVGNLSYDTTEDQLRREFERYGKVKLARVITNRFSRKSKGFGFVEMPVRSEAEAAIKALHDRELHGRKLRVNEARNKTRE